MSSEANLIRTGTAITVKALHFDHINKQTVVVTGLSATYDGAVSTEIKLPVQPSTADRLRLGRSYTIFLVENKQDG